MNIGRYTKKIDRSIGDLNRHIRIAILVLILVLECVGVVVFSKMLPLSDPLKTAIVAPLLLSVLTVSAWYLWSNLGYLSIDAKHSKYSRLPSNKNVPEIHCWEFLYNLRNQTLWDATIFECTITKKKLIKGHELVLEGCEVIDSDTVCKKKILIFVCVFSANHTMVNAVQKQK